MGTLFSKIKEIVGGWAHSEGKGILLLPKQNLNELLFTMLANMFGNKFHSCMIVLVKENSTILLDKSFIFSI